MNMFELGAMASTFSIQTLSTGQVKELLNYAVSPNSEVVYAFRSKNLARILSKHLDIAITPNYDDIKIGKEDILIYAQYCGGRLSEGCEDLPEGTSVTWYKIAVMS